jgi:hypothetical protein
LPKNLGVTGLRADDEGGAASAGNVAELLTATANPPGDL